MPNDFYANLKILFQFSFVPDMCIKIPRGAQIFSALSASPGTRKIEKNNMDIGKTAFETHLGLLKYTREPSGSLNAPATSQRAMNLIFAPMKWQRAPTYINHIIICLKPPEKNPKPIDEVLCLMMKVVCTIKLNKCHFSSSSIDYFSHVIAPRKLHVADNTSENVDALQYPT